MTDLPAEVQLGKVVGKFLVPTHDSADAGSAPDSTAGVGSVRFMPVQPYQRVLLPEPATVGSFSGIFALDSAGYVVDAQGTRGVWLPVGQYEVHFDIKKLRLRPIVIEVTELHTEEDPLDLSVAIPPPGTPISDSQYSELSDRIEKVELAATHGGLPGLDQDDHPQYALADGTRGAFAPEVHTQPASTITDLTETVQDIVAAFLVGGTNVTVSYNDAANTFTINATGGGGGGETDPEIVRDVIGAAMVAGSGIQINVNDAGDTITITSTAVLPTRQVIAGTGLSGGGDLSANRTFNVLYGTTAGTAAQGNDSRLGLAASAVQPGDLAAVATSGDYADLSGAPVVLVAPAATAASINALIAGAADGTIIDLGPVERTLDAPILVANGVHLVGGWTINGSSVAGTRLIFPDVVDTSGGAIRIEHDYATARGIYVTGVTKPAGSIGWHIVGTSGDFTHGVRLYECGAAGFEFGSMNGAYSDHTTYYDCKFSGNDHGTGFAVNSQHDFAYIGCYLEGNAHCSAHAVASAAVANVTFQRTHLGFGQYGVYQEVTVNGNGFAGMTLIDSPIEAVTVQHMKIEYGGNIRAMGGYWHWSGTPANPAVYVKELNTGHLYIDGVRLEPATPNANSPALVNVVANASGNEVEISVRLAGFAATEYSGSAPAIINNRPTNRFYAYGSNKGIAWDANYTYFDTPNVDLRFRKSTDYSVIGRWWAVGNRFIMPEFGIGPAGDSAGPALAAGDGAPSAALPNGSLYLRKNGADDTTAYLRVAGAWVPVDPTGGGGGGSAPTIGYLKVESGRYALAFQAAQIQTNNSFTLDRVYNSPLRLAMENTFDAICCIVGTGAAGAVLRMGVYDADPTTGLPRDLLAEEVADASTAGTKTIVFGTPLTLAPGTYWLAAVNQVASANFSRYAYTSSASWAPFGEASATAYYARLPYQNSVSGSLPAVSSAVPTDWTTIFVSLRGA